MKDGSLAYLPQGWASGCGVERQIGAYGCIHGVPLTLSVPMRQIWRGADKRGGPGRAGPAWAVGGASGRLREDGDPGPRALRALLCPSATEPWRSPLCGRELSRNAARALGSTWGLIKRKASR